MTGDLYRRHWLAITWRDLLVVGYCLLVEHSSLPAFRLLREHWKRAWAKRRWIQERRRASDAEMARWFQAQPAAQPARPVNARPAAASPAART
jgi:hypothetical protein